MHPLPHTSPPPRTINNANRKGHVSPWIVFVTLATIMLGVLNQLDFLNSGVLDARTLYGIMDQDNAGNQQNIQLGWIISFPGSGARYLSSLLEAAVDATNQNALQMHYARTHCGGVGKSSTPPSDYILTPKQFLPKCVDDAHFTLDSKLIKRMVHLFRNPLDNVVARFHQDDQVDSRTTNNPAGFALWCKGTDDRFQGSLEEEAYSKKALELSRNVPCHAEFFKYVQWHNNVVAIKNYMDINTHVMHYGDFRVNFEGTSNAFWRYLQLESILKEGDATTKLLVPQFQFGGYAEYYTGKQKAAIGMFLKEFASLETWMQLERYFPTIKSSDTAAVPSTPKAE